jgi:hypothetical protein
MGAKIDFWVIPKNNCRPLVRLENAWFRLDYEIGVISGMLLTLLGEGIVEFVTKPYQGIVYCRLPSLVGYLYIKAVKGLRQKNWEATWISGRWR